MKKMVVEFKDPISKVNPFVFYIMKNVYANNFEALKEFKTLYRYGNVDYKPLEELLILLDDLKILEKVVTEKRVEQFLKENKKVLKTKLSAYLDKLEREKINLQRDNIFTKYADVFINSEDHIGVFNEGKLGKIYVRGENAFGNTPCDYVINKLLYFYNTIVRRDDEINEDKLNLLINLRNSLKNINRKQKIVPIDKSKCANGKIEDILNMLY